jgi:hypothetical protein
LLSVGLLGWGSSRIDLVFGLDCSRQDLLGLKGKGGCVSFKILLEVMIGGKRF